MKAKFILLSFFIVAFSFFGGTTKDIFDLKVKVVPQTNNSVTSLTEMNKASEVINKRLFNFFGISKENIKLDVTEKQIMLTLHNIDTSKIHLITNVITDNNKLEFWETYENSEIIEYLSKANSSLRDLPTPDKTFKKAEQPKSDLTEKNDVKTSDVDTRKQYSDKDPLFRILGQRVTRTGQLLPSCLVGLADAKDTLQINRYFKMDRIKAIFPEDLKFYWSSNPYKYDPSKTLYGLHAIKVTTKNKQAPLDGSAIISANVSSGSAKTDVKIGLTMDSEGTKTFALLTKANINRCIAVIYKGCVRSYPRVMTEITGGKVEITGDFTIEEANEFVNILNSGELPFKIKITEEQTINMK
jgi:SecD/SecF fusion protein